MGSSSAVGMALTKLKRRIDVRVGPLLMFPMNIPLENREIKVFTGIDDEFPEIYFTDRSNGVQIRYGALSEGT